MVESRCAITSTVRDTLQAVRAVDTATHPDYQGLGIFTRLTLAHDVLVTPERRARYDAEAKYYMCIKAGLLAYMQGYAPAVATEFSRKALLSEVRPTFYEVEEAVAALPPV